MAMIQEQIDTPDILSLKKGVKKYVRLWLGAAFGTELELTDDLILWVKWQSRNNGESVAAWPWHEVGLSWAARSGKGLRGSDLWTDAIAAIALSADITTGEADRALKAMIEAMGNELVAGGRVSIREYFTLAMVGDSGREVHGAHNPPVTRMAALKLKFRQHRSLADAVN